MRLSLGGIFVLLTFCGFQAAVLAQSLDEKRLLEMYFPREDLVVSPTRYPKPISKAAENITVITADEIQAMNAHTVAEVLNRVPGVMPSFSQDFGAPSMLFIQGSESWHALVLVDGAQWNYLGDNADTSSIPVGIIDRIEITKGPASSAWGFSLGGVVNIITKPAGDRPDPKGSVSFAVGEAGTRDYQGQVAGQSGGLGYYLYAGLQESDGIWGHRQFDNQNFFSKFRIPIAGGGAMGFSMGYSEPEIDLGGLPGLGIITNTVQLESHHARTFIDVPVTPEVNFDAIFYHVTHDMDKRTDTSTLNAPEIVELYKDSKGSMDTYGGSLKLAYTGNTHLGVMGFDYVWNDLTEVTVTGPALQAQGAPPTAQVGAKVESWALFMNDTITLDNWSITPGIRFDHINIGDSSLSPSLGVTYALMGTTVIRATIVRGGGYYPLVAVAGIGLFTDPNPDFDPEEVWSYQLGIETTAIPRLWAKTTLYFHDVENAMTIVPGAGGPPDNNAMPVNGPGVERFGIELDAKYRLTRTMSVEIGGIYGDINPAGTGAGYFYTASLGIEYNDPRYLFAELFGKYVEWGNLGSEGSDDGDIVWDLNVSKNIFNGRRMSGTLFFTVHNMFSGSQYINPMYHNPPRWAEAGIRVDF